MGDGQVTDHTGATTLSLGILGTGLSAIGQHWLGLVPAAISLLIYLHKYWRSYRTKVIRAENAQLQAEILCLKAQQQNLSQK